LGDAGVMGGAAADTMTRSGIQTVTGVKTYNDQKLVFRNPADTFSLTQRNPVITANQDTRVNSPFYYYIFKDGTNYYAKNGLTSAIDYSGSVADVVIQSAITAVLATTNGGVIELGPHNFPIITPLDYPTSTGPKPLILRGVRSYHRDMGTVLDIQSSFPTGRYVIETSGCTNGSLKFPSLYLENLVFKNVNFATTNAGCVKWESDASSLVGTIGAQNITAQYMWRGLHLIGGLWWNIFKNIKFFTSNSAFAGDFEIKLEQGVHTGAGNNIPKVNTFQDIRVSYHTDGSTMVNSLNCDAGNYNNFINYTVDANNYTDCVFLFTNKSQNNIMIHPWTLDSTFHSGTRGTLVFDGSTVLDNHVRLAKLTKMGTDSTNSYQVVFANGSYRNSVELVGYWGADLKINNVGTGDYNTLFILPGSQSTAATAPVKPVFTGSSTENDKIRVIDQRKGAYTTGVSTQSGNASTTAFNITHNCFTTPLTYSVTPQTVDARGSPSITATSTNLVITYPSAPPTGSSNLTWVWTAGVY
jgi:hypothetical protein